MDPGSIDLLQFGYCIAHAATNHGAARSRMGAQKVIFHLQANQIAVQIGGNSGEKDGMTGVLVVGKSAGRSLRLKYPTGKVKGTDKRATLK